MKSYREIFRSSAIIGRASLVKIVIGIIRVKVLAVLLGPAGVGLMRLYQSIMGINFHISRSAGADEQCFWRFDALTEYAMDLCGLRACKLRND